MRHVKPSYRGLRTDARKSVDLNNKIPDGKSWKKCLDLGKSRESLGKLDVVVPDFYCENSLV